MTVYNMNNKAMRCYGRIKHTGSKTDNEPIIFLALETDGKPGFSKILFHTRIRDNDMREELIRLVQSEAVQRKPDKLWKVLQNATFTTAPNQSMFNVLYGMDVIRDFPQEHLVYEGVNNEYPSVTQVLDSIQVYENANLMQKEGVSAKLANNVTEQEAKVNGRLNSFEERIGKMEDMLSKMFEMQENILKGTTAAKASSKKVLKDEPVAVKAEKKPEPVVEQEAPEDEFEVGLPPRVC